ncbi:putative ATPase domain protein [Burkholderia pseudomallei ABCPW 107]|nr:putative ATPase domain protein [Burkholderia pseudomallei ABCPW 107]
MQSTLWGSSRATHVSPHCVNSLLDGTCRIYQQTVHAVSQRLGRRSALAVAVTT